MARPASSEVQALSPSDPLPRGRDWGLGFSPDAPPEVARQQLHRRYGQQQ